MSRRVSRKHVASIMATAVVLGLGVGMAHAAVTPVRTSPTPPAAIAGLPVRLSQLAPSGLATTVLAPFRITVTW